MDQMTVYNVKEVMMNDDDELFLNCVVPLSPTEYFSIFLLIVLLLQPTKALF